MYFMLQEFVEIVVHMAMIFLALSMLDKLESFFQDLVSVSSVSYKSIPDTPHNQPEQVIYLQLFIQKIFFECLLYARHSSGYWRFSSQQKEDYKFSF